MPIEIPPDVRAIYPFDSHFTAIEGNRIHYLDEGNRTKPTVVLLHGNPTWSFLYREIVPKISHACRAIAPDYVGMGLSEKPRDERWFTLENHTRIVTSFIERLGLKNIILVMQDWGGPIGLGYAQQNLQNIAGMLFMNTWAWPDPSVFHASIFPWRMMHAPLVGAHFFLRRDILVRRAMYLSVGARERLKPGPILDGYMLPYREPLDRLAMLSFPRNIPLKQGDPNWDRLAAMERLLGKIECPCRLLWGEKDQVFPPENARRFHRALKICSNPRMIPEGRHFVQEDAPEEIAEEILALVEVAAKADEARVARAKRPSPRL